MKPQRRSAAGPGAKALATLLVAIAHSTFGISQLSVIRDVNPAGSVLTDIGADVASIPDLDGDGVADLVIGCPAPDFIASAVPSRVQIRSGLDGHLIRSLLPPATLAGACFGASVAVISDLDGDGKRDIVVGAPQPTGAGFGRCTIHSSATGAVLSQPTVATATTAFGAVVRNVGDVNADGKDDFVVADPGRYFTLSGSGGVPNAPTPITPRAYLLSGTSGALIRQFLGSVAGPNFTVSLQCPGDVNTDGFPDILYGVDQRIDAISGATGALLHTASLSAIAAPFVPPSFAAIDDRNSDGARDFIALRVNVVGATPTTSVDVISGRTGTLIQSIVNPTPGDGFGLGLAAVGDQNGDLVPDWIATAPTTQTIHVHSGASGARIRSIVVPGAAAVGVTALGTTDLTGDGIGEFVVAGIGTQTGLNDGRLVCVRGGPSPVVRFDLSADQGQDAFGHTVALGGDLTGDGIPDLLIGSPFRNPSELGNAGRVSILSGANGAIAAEIAGTTASETFGFALTSIGDVTGDGIPEFAASAPRAGAPIDGPGAVSVFDGATRALVYSILGSTSGDGFGAALATISDLDGDGHRELVIGVAGAVARTTLPARTEVHSGLTGVLLFTINVAAASVPLFDVMTLASAGDVDGDGKEDIAVSLGAPSPTTTGTVIRLYSSNGGSLIRTLIAPPSAQSSILGIALAAPGDVDGDGITDLAAGLASTSPSQGALVFFSGATGAILRQIVGPLGFGASHAAVGDWNGDGVGDVVAGNPGFLGTPQQSSVHAYSGATGLLIDAFVPTGSAADMGFAVASAGDVDSDGFVEVAVGAPGLVIPAGTGFPSSAGRVVLLSAPGFASGTAEFGTGCPAVNGRVPRLLTIGGPPSVLSGNPRFGLVVGSAVAGQPMAWLLGTSTTNWQGSSLPLDLGVYGLSGCQLIISPDLLVPSATHAGAGGVGTAVLPVPIPIDPNLYGFAVGVQAFIQNPSGALGAMTAALIVSAQ